MEPINLDPNYSTSNVPGRCLKCLAEHELDKCLSQLLKTDCKDDQSAKKFEFLLEFLKSPESQALREESEKYLAEGKQVTVIISFADGKPKYELKIT